MTVSPDGKLMFVGNTINNAIERLEIGGYSGVIRQLTSRISTERSRMFRSRYKTSFRRLGVILLAMPLVTTLAQDSDSLRNSGQNPASATSGETVRQSAPQEVAPAADVSGKWVFERDVKTRTDEPRTQVLTMTLKQEGNTLTGQASFTTINVNRDGAFAIHGWIEGNQVGISAWVDWEGGESIGMRLTFQDGRLTGTKNSVHDAPHKWKLDNSIEMHYSRAPV
jgi:hypothetical protein